ncbi:hypothetical protein PI124_g10604 [Phytophthora idaei]|nr:hypothetical protein PI125_g11687 [Phytophthora idaei]KAG3151620.1 hypothetical protein PI126_g10896 [Phytophthora idaei]KAG3244611.1 hypothetical protein PI124_g10604 [Phytophthora idaei]
MGFGKSLDAEIGNETSWVSVGTGRIAAWSTVSVEFGSGDDDEYVPKSNFDPF